jgi:hypothetical protein
MIPSVTQVLAPFADFSMIRPEILEAAATRGTVLHGAYASYCLGLWIPKLAEDYQTRFDSWRRWFDQAVVETVAVEPQLICHQHNFSGRPDWIGRIKGDKCLALADWKHPVLSSPGWRCQVAAYHHLAKEEYGAERVLVVQPHPKGGKAKVVEHTGTLAQDFATFLNGLTIYNFMKGGS